MRPASLLSECARNIGSGTTRAMLGLLMLTSSLLAALTMDGLEARSIMLDQRQMLNSGAATVTVAAPGGIDPERCASLNDVSGVHGAFAFRAAQARLNIAALPDSSVPLYDTVGNPLGVLGGTSTHPTGILLASQLAHLLSLAPSETLALIGPEPSTGLAGTFTYPEDGRDSQLAAAALQPSPPQGQFDSCWFTIWPPNPTLERLSASVLVTGVDTGTVTTGQLNQTLGLPTDTNAVLAQRPTRFLPAVAAILAALITFTLVRTRRVEFAIARHLGQTRRDQSIQILIETSAWALTSTALTAALLSHTLSPSLTRDELTWVLTSTGTVLAGCMLATLTGALTAALTITERRMNTWPRDK